MKLVPWKRKVSNIRSLDTAEQLAVLLQRHLYSLRRESYRPISHQSVGTRLQTSLRKNTFRVSIASAEDGLQKGVADEVSDSSAWDIWEGESLAKSWWRIAVLHSGCGSCSFQSPALSNFLTGWWIFNFFFFELKMRSQVRLWSRPSLCFDKSKTKLVAVCRANTGHI